MAVEGGEKPLGQAATPASAYAPLATDVTALQSVPGFSRCGDRILTIWLRQATRLLLATCVIGLSVPALWADQPQEVLQVIGHMTSALGDNDAVDAMSVVDRSCPHYDELSNDLSNLVSSYLLTNEADVIDEEDKPNQSVLTLDWSLTLQSQSTDQSKQRRQQVHVVLAKKNSAWKIVEFKPVSLFSPQM